MNIYVLMSWAEDFDGHVYQQLSLAGTETKLEPYLRVVKKTASNLEERMKVLGEERFKEIYSVRQINYLYAPIKYVA